MFGPRQLRKRQMKRLVDRVVKDEAVNAKLVMIKIFPFFNSSTSLVAGSIWLAITLAVTAFCFYQVGSLVARYFSWNLGVQVSNVDTEPVPLPSIFICTEDSDQSRQFCLEHNVCGSKFCLSRFQTFLGKHPEADLNGFYERLDPKLFVESISLKPDSLKSNEIRSKAHHFLDTSCRQFIIDRKVLLRSRSLELSVHMMPHNSSIEGSCTERGSTLINILPNERLFWKKFELTIVGRVKTEISFFVSKYENVNSPNKPCVTAAEYTNCERNCYDNLISDMVQNASCVLDLKHIPAVDKPRCKTGESAVNFLLKLVKLSKIKCVCTRICDNIEYLPFPLMDEDVSSDEVLITPQSPFVRTVKEYYLISLISLFCDVGGNVGLYLGFSALSIVELLIAFKVLCFARLNETKGNRLYELINRTYISIMEKFGSSYAVIGFDQIFNLQRGNLTKRLLWSIIQLTAIVICGVQATKLVNLYLAQPIHTSLEVVQDNMVTLPDLVVCVESDRFVTKRRKWTRDLKDGAAVDKCQLRDLYDFIDHPDLTADGIWKAMNLKSSYIRDFLVSMYRQVEGLETMDSKWQYNYSTVLGECSRLHRDVEKYVDFWTNHVMFSMQRVKTCPICESQMFLIPDGEFFDLKKQISVVCGMFTTISIQRQTIIKLNVTRRPCGSWEESTLCEEKCKRKLFQENINCSLPFVSGDRLDRCNSSATAKQTRAAYLRAYVGTDHIKQCGCLPKCNETLYIPVVFTALSSTNNGGSLNLVKLTNNFREIFKESLAFTMVDLVSNIGATLSAMTGVSVLTLMQLTNTVINNFNK